MRFYPIKAIPIFSSTARDRVILSSTPSRKYLSGQPCTVPGEWLGTREGFSIYALGQYETPQCLAHALAGYDLRENDAGLEPINLAEEAERFIDYLNTCAADPGLESLEFLIARPREGDEIASIKWDGEGSSSALETLERAEGVEWLVRIDAGDDTIAAELIAAAQSLHTLDAEKARERLRSRLPIEAVAAYLGYRVTVLEDQNSLALYAFGRKGE